MSEIKKAAFVLPLHGRPLRIALGVGMLSLVAVGGWFPLRSRGLHRWLFSYCTHAGRRGAPAADEQVHALICIGDHFEPHNGQVSDQQARARLDHWLKQYPASFTQFRDADGRFPQHTFFYPVEQYRADHVESIATLCRAGFGEIEIHLHHDNDTSDNLRRALEEGKNLLASRHGMLARHARTGELAYGFIHGDWALDNSSPDGSGCGVNNELDILRETGCYADFTLPSAPSLSQTSKINSIYYAIDDPYRPMSHNTGTDVGRSPRPEKSLMLIQGPLLFNWGRRKFGLIPAVENACLQGNQQASMARLDLWLRARVQVPQRPDWFFIKLHAHGANEDGHKAILSSSMEQFHRDLAERSRRNPNFHYHYVTAREMYNLARAAEAGWKGSVADARNFELVCNFADMERKKTA